VPVAVVVAAADGLPRSASARDELALREVEQIMGIELVRYLDGALA
jgi:tellurite resistance protein